MRGLPGLAALLRWVERGYIPDVLVRWGIRRLCAEGLRVRSALDSEAEQEQRRALLATLRASPIAVHMDAANEQHYELPPEFFALCLGRHRKYSGCLWPLGVDTLDAAEEAALTVTCEHAGLADGQDILELGCGWGSLALWMAEHYPRSRITAVSNSVPQRHYIEGRCAARGLRNLTVHTADMNDYSPATRFDRVVSVEMFEHMRNYEALLARIADWLRPEGRLFVHIFAHRRGTYFYETEGPANWLGRYFFTGGIMPADDLLSSFQRDLLLVDQWRQSGRHYEATANAWLENLDARRTAALALLKQVYGARDAAVWLQRWRVFFMACAELFGYDGGNEWWVAHYLFAPRAAPAGQIAP